MPEETRPMFTEDAYRTDISVVGLYKGLTMLFSMASFTTNSGGNYRILRIQLFMLKSYHAKGTDILLNVEL
jgi:hypothetical protein